VVGRPCRALLETPGERVRFYQWTQSAYIT
jgi:hypothetical protein